MKFVHTSYRNPMNFADAMILIPKRTCVPSYIFYVCVSPLYVCVPDSFMFVSPGGRRSRQAVGSGYTWLGEQNDSSRLALDIWIQEGRLGGGGKALELAATGHCDAQR